MEFEEFVKKEMQKNQKSIPLEFKDNKCPDIVVGKDGVFWFEKAERKKHKNDLYEGLLVSKKNEKRIVIILESPHKDEFKKSIKKDDFFDDECEANPALGRTGIKLQEYFNDKVVREKLKIEGHYCVILMNSVQYQCSLGEKTKLYRDCIWLKYWFEKETLNSFEQRLNEYKPNIVVNLCTKGNYKGRRSHLEKCLKKIPSEIPNKKDGITLREIVSIYVKKVFPKMAIYEGNHPCSWWTNKGIDSITIRE